MTKSNCKSNPVSDAEALRLVMEMMAIPGRSGEEAAIMDFIRGKLIDGRRRRERSCVSTMPHRRTPLGGQVGNLVLKLPGTIRGPRRMLSAHVDTVPICVGSRPVRKGKHVSSARTRRPASAPTTAPARPSCSRPCSPSCARKLPHPPLTFLWTVQEEVGLFGARYVKTVEARQAEAGVQLRRRLAGEARRSARRAAIA